MILSRCLRFSCNRHKNFLKNKREFFCKTISSTEIVLVSFSQMFYFFCLFVCFNDPKSALVNHSTEESILSCFTGVTVLTKSFFTDFIRPHTNNICILTTSLSGTNDNFDTL